MESRNIPYCRYATLSSPPDGDESVRVEKLRLAIGGEELSRLSSVEISFGPLLAIALTCANPPRKVPSRSCLLSPYHYHDVIFSDLACGPLSFLKFAVSTRTQVAIWKTELFSTSLTHRPATAPHRDNAA